VRGVREDEDGQPRRAGRSVGVPPRERVVVGGPAADHGAGAGDAALEHVAAGRIVVHRPGVQRLAALAPRLVGPRVRGPDVSVEGHAHVEDHGAHDSSLCHVLGAQPRPAWATLRALASAASSRGAGVAATR
jgi:hypothetical protein